MLRKLYVFVFLVAVFASNTALATIITDNFDTDPFLGRWTNERGTSVWSSTNLEFDLGDNQARPGARYVQNNPGSVDEEAQVTFQHTNQFSDNTQGGPAVRFRDDGTDDWYWVTVNASNDTYTLFRNNDGGATQLAQGTLVITTGDFITIRLSASGGVGGNVLLNVWIQNHGSSKPSDPGWIGNDNSPNLTFTDTDPSRLNTANHIQVGIAGEAFGMPVDSRHDFFKARAISDRTGGVTPPPPPGDTTPPVISSISVSSITTTGATITWTTNESSSAVVQYGPTTSYGQTQSSGGTTSHSVTLSGLNSSTQYNFRISATDSSNNNSVSANQTFSTQAVVTPNPTPTPTPPPPTPVGTRTFDTSEYRQNTYGVPNRYCDPTKSLSVSGSGTLADPWNMNQCKSLPVCGNVVGILNNGSGTSVSVQSSGIFDIPAFQPTGITDCTSNNRLVYTTRYAAIGLSRTNIGTNPYRSEFRHNGSPALGDNYGTGGPMIGSNNHDYVTYDGFYIDMAYAPIREDSGVLHVRDATGVEFRNFKIKGAVMDVDSNAVIYRPGATLNTVLSNFEVWDYDNVPTAGGLNQQGTFSDQYGDQNFLIEHFLIDRTDGGIFPKGTANSSSLFNSGTIQYGVITNNIWCLNFNAINPSTPVIAKNILCTNWQYMGVVIGLIDITRNIILDHVTVANGACSDPNCSGPIYIKGSAPMGTGNFIRDSIIDWRNGGFGNGIDAGEVTAPLPTMYNNAYYKAGASLRWSYNGAAYTTLASWRTVSGQDGNSVALSSDPFTNRSSLDFTTLAGSPVKTMSSTGGEIGAYGGTETVGPILPTGTYPSTGSNPPTPTPTPTSLAGDLNVDHVINSLDWSIMNSQWLSSNSQSDLRVDGQVNSLDFAILSSNWGRTW